VSTPRDDERVRVHSADFGTWFDDEPTTTLWQRQAHAVLTRVPVRGVDIVVDSTLPIGAGLSSSAAYIAALVLELGFGGSLAETVALCAEAEREAGTPVGLLDQYGVLGPLAGHGLLLDFSDESWQDIPISPNVGFTVVHSEMERDLATSEYGVRRQQCANIARIAGDERWSRSSVAPTLSDPLLLDRGKHVWSENIRVSSMIAALEQGGAAVGALLNESHHSLRDCFDVVPPAVDDVWMMLNALPGVWGSRQLGGGFGGCLLVAHEETTSIVLRRHRSWRVTPSAGGFERLSRLR
jgi:galactokinase